MMKCIKQHGNASVRIGVTGRGIKPCYRITFTDCDGDQIFGSYWDNHEKLDREDAESRSWSTRSMAFDQIDTLLKEKIDWKQKVKPSE